LHLLHVVGGRIVLKGGKYRLLEHALASCCSRVT
jgi:hypothetical protein